MARARPHPLAAARLVLAPLLAVVGVLAGLLLGQAALSPAPRPFASAPSFAGPVARASEATLSLALVSVRQAAREQVRGPAISSAATPATLAGAQLALRDEAGRLFEEGSSTRDESLTSRRLGPRPQATKPDKRWFGDLPSAAPPAAGSPLLLAISASFAAGSKLRALDLRKNVRIESIDRDAHAPRGPPSKLSV